jgi:hypothetical protein
MTTSEILTAIDAQIARLQEARDALVACRREFVTALER